MVCDYDVKISKFSPYILEVPRFSGFWRLLGKA